MAIQSVQVQRKLFTVAEYDQMIRAGVLHEDDRLELIEGEIIEISPIGSAHLAHVNRLTHLLVQLYGRNEIVECWLIDLVADVIEVYRGPAATGYRIKQTYGPGDSISLAGLPSLSVAAEEILS